MSRPKRPAGRRPRPHAQLHLPALSAEQAQLLVHVLQRAIEAIYRAHGEAMADLTEEQIDPPPHRILRWPGTLPDDFPF